MMFRNALKNFCQAERHFSFTTVSREKFSCKLLVVGGGSGGCATAAKFSRVLKKSELIVLEPSEYHYYKPLFTLVGAGDYSIEDSRKKEKDVLPRNCTWLKDKASEYDPEKNNVYTEKGHTIEYDYLLVAVGLELRCDKIPGLLDALETPSDVCSIYSPNYASHTYELLQNLSSGHALFTYPNSPVTCPGAPQKICYITDHYLRKHNRRNFVKVTYNTPLPVIFCIKTYADALWKVCTERDINVNFRTNLIKVDAEKKEALFENLDNPEKKKIEQYSMLHVTPPMGSPKTLSKNKQLTNDLGFVEVNKHTLQHVRFKNVFAIGDCSSTPNSKTAAAAAAQTEVVYQNLSAVMKCDAPPLTYDGYTSCPLVTGDKCILAEFGYDLIPLETFPFSQARELRSMYFLKKYIMPSLYWHLMLNGYWNGPALVRKIMHFGLSNK